MTEKTTSIDDLKEIHIIPYCHTDFAWTNCREWHISRYLATYCKMLDIMGENREYTSVLDNIVHSLKPFLKYRPNRFEELRQRILEGRVNVCNGGWSLVRPTQVGEETFIRNLVEGHREFRRLFGDDFAMDCYFNADTAMGHGQLPQIVRLMGYKYYNFQRPEAYLNSHGIPKQFRWRGLDGSEVLAARGCYGGFMTADYCKPGTNLPWEKVREGYAQEELTEHLNRLPTGVMAQFQGMDDMLPYTNRFDEPLDLDGFIKGWNENERSHMGFSTLSRFFAALEKEELPLVTGSADPHDVTYNAPVKGSKSMWHMRYACDALLTELESVCAILRQNGGEYPEAELRAFWLRLFEITGHAIEAVIKEDHDRLYSAALGLVGDMSDLLDRKLDELASITGRGGENEYAIVNTLGQSEMGLVKLQIASENGVRDFRLYDLGFNRLEYQIVNTLNGDKDYTSFHYSSMEVLVKVGLPSLAAGNISVQFGESKHRLLTESETALLETALESARQKSRDYVIDAGRIKVRFQDGLLAEVVSGSDELTGAMPLMNLRFAETKPTDSWLFDFNTISESVFEPEDCAVIHNGPLRWRYRVRGTVGNSPTEILYTVDEPTGVVRVDVEIDNREKNGIYSADFDCDRNTGILADMPFGFHALDMEELTGNICDEYELTLPGQYYAKSWTEFARDGKKLGLMSRDCSTYYRFDKDKGAISLMLTRVASLEREKIGKLDQWVPQMDRDFWECRGLQRFSFALTPSRGSTDLTKKTRELRRPLRSARSFIPASARCAGSVFAPTDNGIVTVTGLYRENGAYIVRFHETNGTNTALTAAVSEKVRRVVKTDLKGLVLEEIPLVSSHIHLKLRAFEIVTLRLEDE